MFCKDDRGCTAVAALVVGGVIGAALALLFAPQSGKRTRDQIADLAEDLTDSVGGYAKKVREKLT